MIATETRHAYCLCGASLHGQSRPPDAIRALVDAFRELHQGPGHGPATSAQARKARRREEYRLLREGSGS